MNMLTIHCLFNFNFQGPRSECARLTRSSMMKKHHKCAIASENIKIFPPRSCVSLKQPVDPFEMLKYLSLHRTHDTYSTEGKLRSTEYFA